MQRARLGILIAPEVVHAVALGPGKNPRVIAHVEVPAAGLGELPAATAEAVQRLGHVGPVRAVLLGGGAHHLHLRVPKMSAGETREALWHHAHKEIGEPPEAFLTQTWFSPVGLDAQRDVVQLLLPREPTETIAARLLARGCPLESVTTPAALTPIHDPDQDGGVLWAEIGGTRTCITLLNGHRVELTREIPRRLAEEDDFVATVERRLADFQEIERSILYYREKHDSRGIQRVILSGAREEIEPTRDQIAPPMQELGIEIELSDAWAGIERGEALPASAAIRSALAARAAMSRDCISVVPEVVRGHGRRRQSRMIAAVAAVAVGGASMIFAASARLERAALESRLEASIDRLDAAAEPGTLAEPIARSSSVRIRPVAVRDWSELFREVGLLAGPGIDYDHVRLSSGEDGIKLRIEGQARSGGAAQTGELLSDYFDQLLESPFSTGLPRLEASSELASRGAEAVRFAVEADVVHRPDSGETP